MPTNDFKEAIARAFDLMTDEQKLWLIDFARAHALKKGIYAGPTEKTAGVFAGPSSSGKVCPTCGKPT